MDQSFNYPATPGMPLFSLSPDRVNTLPQTPSPTYNMTSDSPGKDSGHPAFEFSGDFDGKHNYWMNIGAGENAAQSPFSFSQGSPFKAPSLPGSPTKHSRTNSEVQAMVSRFNTLDIQDHAELRRKEAAALKRAQMGREEAEAELRRAREEITATKDEAKAILEKAKEELNMNQEEIAGGKEREKKVMKRLDVVMDESHRAKETQAQAKTLYEKEIRKSKKEAFRASSSLVKLQEELKAARKTLRTAQSELELERLKGSRREQETFTAQYQLVGVQEELAREQTKIKIVEEEREALKTTLKKEEVTRNAAEGSITLPPVKDEDHEFASPKKRRIISPWLASESMNASSTVDIEHLKTELEKERKQRTLVEEQMEFMKMECQFKSCSCMVAERSGAKFIHDGTFDIEMLRIKATVASMLTPPASVILDHLSEEWNLVDDDKHGIDEPHESMSSSTSGRMLLAEEYNSRASTVELVMRSNTAASSAGSMRSRMAPEEAAATTDEAGSVPERSRMTNLLEACNTIRLEWTPATPVDKTIRTITTTTTIPLADQSTVDYSTFATPTGLTREQAIEQLRQRRGRARSAVGTPGKIQLAADEPRRDISAPDMRAKVTVTPRSISRGKSG